MGKISKYIIIPYLHFLPTDRILDFLKWKAFADDKM